MNVPDHAVEGLRPFALTACLGCGVSFARTGYAHKRCHSCAKDRAKRIRAKGPIIGDPVPCLQCGTIYSHRNGKKGICDKCAASRATKRSRANVKKWKANLPDDRRAVIRKRNAERMAEKREASECRERRNAAARRARALLPWSAIRIRNALAEVRNLLNSIDRLWHHHTRPWIVAGFKTRDEWERSTHEGREARRLEWQVRAKGHRASVRRQMRDTGALTRAGWLAICKSWDYRCAYCGRHRTEFRNAARREDIEMDHVIPIGREGFEHSPRNIVPACKSCNASKSDNDLLAWACQNGATPDPRVFRMFEQLGGVV